MDVGGPAAPSGRLRRGPVGWGRSLYGVVNRRDVGSWLQGPESVTGVSGYPGERLGFPETGRGSLARPGRRFFSLLIDWVICLVIARSFFPEQMDPGTAGALIPLGVLFVENLLLAGTTGYTIGQRVLGLRVERVSVGGPIGLYRSLIRAVLMILVVPPITMGWDADRRGLHDLLSGSVVVRT
ncbi:RDD family protein [Kineosporia sp. NBRC 101677]|nr:RDD family protein [Kineosporia sp. NBRC 101677]